MASPPVSPSLTRTTSETDSTGNLTPATTWTSEQEARLAYCQDQLKQAQKKWSDRQELWIREVEHLVELKRAHKKAQKKQKAREDKSLRKAKTWRPLSRTQSNVVDSTASASAAGTSPDDDDGGGDEDSLAAVERSDSMPQQTSGRNPFKKIIRRMSSAGGPGKGRGNSVAEAEEGGGGGGARNEG
ncbi:MAG: hypothetical protein ALECFALPRED_009633 [Alectoria fallacina]|uniref:Uncharacterized protein n=1 Tax=Alectoria fallacina TaxID=1903189 RepID=A0A8H3J7M2_9LECA|nr:MAG: hypothetical protein ALECFALPRED_009633 [Alectoria fallacina]